jgi:predicted RNA-binding Zn ribbon-like protein
MPLEAFIVLGDALWLDFVNTARGRTAFPPDQLPDPDAYAAWCARQQVAGAGGAIPFPRVLAFRDRLSELAEALADRRQVPGAAIAALNDLLGRSPGIQRLTRVRGEWRLRFAPVRAPEALEAIARSAAATLVDTRLAVRRCAAEGCSLLFADDSPTGVRRWCDPATCGLNGRVERRRGLRR